MSKDTPFNRRDCREYCYLIDSISEDPNLSVMLKGIEILFNEVNWLEDFKGFIDCYYRFYIMLYVGVCFIQMKNLNIHETVRNNSINVKYNAGASASFRVYE
ncbi:hypothetical protein TSUD_68860 [Trifolium subterraneum]|uniref:Uncharacterized protein n=1 Tax=Trifolium subterraneum TaxID=3900 RepID=A0A2Z6N4J8_TRISU|nr:hypothetical protein TSUD_68860 [Trifolium subterraneum]